MATTRIRKVLAIGLALVLGLNVALSGAINVQAQDLLGPGDTINGLTLEVLDVGPESARFFNDCTSISTEPEAAQGEIAPGNRSRVCSVPLTEDLVIGSGWLAQDQETLEANWAAITWELYIDSQRVDLYAFGFNDFDRVVTIGDTETTLRARFWRVAADALTTGIYELRHVTRVSHDAFDGFETTLAGTHTYDTYLRVGDAPPVDLGNVGMPKTGVPVGGLPMWWLVGAFGVVSLGLVSLALGTGNQAFRRRRD